MKRILTILWLGLLGLLFCSFSLTMLVLSGLMPFPVAGKIGAGVGTAIFVSAPTLLGGIAAFKSVKDELFSCRIQYRVNSKNKIKMKLRRQHKRTQAPLAYDPAWIIELAKKQIPERIEIINSLRSCTSVIGFCGCGCGKLHFIDPASDQWDFQESVDLVGNHNWWDAETISLTIMKDGRIGAIGISPPDLKFHGKFQGTRPDQKQPH